MAPSDSESPEERSGSSPIPEPHARLRLRPPQESGDRSSVETAVAPPRIMSSDESIRRLEARLEWQDRGLKLLAATSADLLRLDTEDSRLSQLFERLRAHLHSDMFFYYRFEQGKLHLVDGNGLSESQTLLFRTLSPGEQLCGSTALGTGLLHLQADEIAVHPCGQAARSLGVRSYVGIPLRDRDQLLGTLGFVSLHRDRFTDDELDFLETLGNVVAAAKARRKAVRRLEASEARYRAAIETSADGMLIGDERGNLLDVNEAYLKRSGYTRDELLRLKVSDLDAELTARELFEYVDRTRRDGVARFETTHRAADGSLWPIEVSASFHLAPDPIFYCFTRDLTDRRRAESALRESESRTRLAVEASGILLWEADPETNDFVHVMGSPQALLGYRREDWLAPNFWWDHMHVDDRDAAVEFCHQSSRNDDHYRFEYRMHRVDGAIVWLEDVVHVERADGRIVRLKGLMLDITERKQIEERLRQSQKLEAVGRLAGGVAHDFNNLLTVINGYSELLSHSIADHQDPRHEWLGAMIDAGERARRLVDQLLVFSRKSHVPKQVIELDALVRQSGSLLKRLIGEDIELSVDCGATGARVEADPTLLEQVLMNLALNGRDAMPRGGRLTITTRPCDARSIESAREREIEGSKFADGRCVELIVADSGIGIEPELLPHIFEPFFTTKEIGQGTGLGLAVVYGIVRRSEGTIDIDSRVGEGTRVRVRLPIVDLPLSARESVETDVRAGNETILLVEDEEGVRRIARLALERRGYRVLEASSAEEALTVAERTTEPIDLLLTDVIMAGIGGSELARRLRSARPELQVLFMSGYTDEAILTHGVGHESPELLRKPFTPDSLARKVGRTLAARRG